MRNTTSYYYQKASTRPEYVDDWDLPEVDEVGVQHAAPGVVATVYVNE